MTTRDQLDSLSMADLKVRITKESLLFYVHVEGKDLVVSTLPGDSFKNFLPDTDLKEEATKLQNSYKSITGVDKELKYFESIIMSITEKHLFSKLDKSMSEGERLKSLVIYHVKTLTSIRNKVAKDQEEALEYIETELYNMSNIKIEDLLKILDTITEKRKKK